MKADWERHCRIDGQQQIGDFTNRSHYIIRLVRIAQLHHGHYGVGKNAQNERKHNGDQHETYARLGLLAVRRRILSLHFILIDTSNDTIVQIDEQYERYDRSQQSIKVLIVDFKLTFAQFSVHQHFSDMICASIAAASIGNLGGGGGGGCGVVDLNNLYEERRRSGQRKAEKANG
jgi:hypothetical protein